MDKINTPINRAWLRCSKTKEFKTSQPICWRSSNICKCCKAVVPIQTQKWQDTLFLNNPSLTKYLVSYMGKVCRHKQIKKPLDQIKPSCICSASLPSQVQMKDQSGADTKIPIRECSKCSNSSVACKWSKSQNEFKVYLVVATTKAKKQRIPTSKTKPHSANKPKDNPTPSSKDSRISQGDHSQGNNVQRLARILTWT